MLLVILRLSRLSEGDIRYTKGWAAFKLPCFSLFKQHRVKLSEAPEQHRNPWAILKREIELRFTVKLWCFNNFCCWLSRAREARPAGHGNSADTRVPSERLSEASASLYREKLCKSAGLLISSKSRAWHPPDSFRHSNWKGICVLCLWIDLAYKKLFCHKIMILPQHCNACSNLRKSFSPSLSSEERS